MIHETLVQARNRVDQGWTQGAWRTDDGKVCAASAVVDAAREAGDATAAFGCLVAVLGLEVHGHHCREAFQLWNDAHGRTKEQVLDAFDAAIAATAPEPFPVEFCETTKAVVC